MDVDNIDPVIRLEILAAIGCIIGCITYKISEYDDNVSPSIPSEHIEPVVYVCVIKKHKIKETNLPPELQVVLTEKVLKTLWCFLKKNFCLKKSKCGEPISNVLDSLNVDVPDVIVGVVIIHYDKEKHVITIGPITPV